MMISGWLVGRIDLRLQIGAGFSITAISLGQMTRFDLLMDGGPVFWSGVVQGFGTGMAYVPMAAMAFATLLPELRNQGTTTFSLMRNIGSSIGISIVQALLSRNTQTMHSTLPNISPLSVAPRTH
jgi:DHA2 family multidrug resistance protein